MGCLGGQAPSTAPFMYNVDLVSSKKNIKENTICSSTAFNIWTHLKKKTSWLNLSTFEQLCYKVPR